MYAPTGRTAVSAPREGRTLETKLKFALNASAAREIALIQLGRHPALAARASSASLGTSCRPPPPLVRDRLGAYPFE
jgi:hypothetical protein